MEKLLSVGAIDQILEDQNPTDPVLQIIGYKPMPVGQKDFDSNPTEELRYRLMIGDGSKTHQYCVITNQDIVDDIRNNRLEKWSIIKLTSYQTADYGERRLIYVLNLEIIKKGSEVGAKLVCSLQPQQQQQYQYQPQPQTPQRQQQSLYHQSSPRDLNNTQPQPYPNMGNTIPDFAARTPNSNRSSNTFQTIGIADLTPYIGKWVVKGRVTSKSAIREYNNAKGGGKLFNFTLADKTGEIKVTAFNTDCERVYPYVEQNKVYVLGRASVKNADKRYTTADFEITLNNDSLLEEVNDSNETKDIPLVKFNFVAIGSLSNISTNQPVDLIGAIDKVEEVTVVNSKTKNKELKKRNVTIVDMSRHSICVTIWGEQSESFIGIEGDVMVTKAARLSNYGGKSASAGDCIFINPDIPETRKIKNWFSGLIERNFTPLTSAQEQTGVNQWRTLDQMLNIELAKTQNPSGYVGLSGKVKAIIIAVGKNPVYKCCPNGPCKKKLVDTQNGELKCDKCQQTFTTWRYRYQVSVEIADQTANSWVTLWEEKADILFNMSAEELERHMKMENKEMYDKIMTRPAFKPFVFSCRARVDTYNGEERVRLDVNSISVLTPVPYAKKLMEQIKTFTANPIGVS